MGNQQGWACLLGKRISILFICVEFNRGKCFIKTILSLFWDQSEQSIAGNVNILGASSDSFICFVLLFNSGCAPYLKGLSCTFCICWTTWQLVKYVTMWLEQNNAVDILNYLFSYISEAFCTTEIWSFLTWVEPYELQITIIFWSEQKRFSFSGLICVILAAIS